MELLWRENMDYPVLLEHKEPPKRSKVVKDRRLKLRCGLDVDCLLITQNFVVGDQLEIDAHGGVVSKLAAKNNS